MRIDVIFGPSALNSTDVQGRLAVVIDVLRASSTIATALANGARNMIPLDSVEEAINRSKSFDRGEVALAGERRMLPIPGFEFGNSPSQFTSEAIAGKSILFTTTNGTVALIAVQGAREVFVAGFVNFSAVLTVLRAAVRSQNDIMLLCAGSDRHFALEDAVCAGRYVRALLRRTPELEINDAALVALTVERGYRRDITQVGRDASHARALREAGLERDVADCLTLDSFPVIPLYAERQITRLGTARGGGR
ncbi:MAG: 2-phosphosulfolactate phosphatase [Gemmatimonadota bacterium]